MAIIYSYPTVTPERSDLLVGTEMTGTGEDAPRSRTFSIGSIVDLVNPTLDLKANIASPTFTGSVTSPLFIKTGGTSAQFLKADGNTSTMPTLQEVTTAGSIISNRITVQSNISGDEGLINVVSTGEDMACLYAYSTQGYGVSAQTDTGVAILGNTDFGTNLLLTKITSGDFIKCVKNGSTLFSIDRFGHLGVGMGSNSQYSVSLSTVDAGKALYISLDNPGSTGIDILQDDTSGTIPFTYRNYIPGEPDVYETLTSINNAGQVTAAKFIVTNGVSSQYLMANGNFASNIATNSTTTVLSLATLNSTYPTAIIGFRVHCASITVTKLIYEKTATGWVSYLITVVV